MRIGFLCSTMVLLAATGCGGGDGRGRGDGGVDDDASVGVDASVTVDAAPLAQANIDDVVQCGAAPPVGPGNVAEFQRHVIDQVVFPDALCNDGTPAAIYFRPYTGAANRNKWVLNLHGGGGCGSGASCIARWCGCNNTTECPYTTAPTNFTRSTMTNDGPAQKAADGIFLRGDTVRVNPLGDYNQVEFSYCTSDGWHGNQRAVSFTTVNPKTNAPVTFTIHFLGAKVLDANIATLRQAGVPALVYTRGGAQTALPDLDEATEIVITGDSAGGAGVISNLDFLTDTLRASNTACSAGGACPLKTYGLIDAVVGPDRSKLDYGTHVVPQIRSWMDYITLAAQNSHNVGARKDASCEAWHAANMPATAGACSDESHVVRHHITTPFFVRMALIDQLISGNYIEDGLRNADMSPMTVATFARTLHDELASFGNLSASAEEGSLITKQPGVFAPLCSKHDTIHSTADTFGTTITPAGGTAQRLLGVFTNWQAGLTPSNVLTQSPTGADTVCP